jgi:hypothetical protein
MFDRGQQVQDESEEIVETVLAEASRNQTAKKAARFLLSKSKEFVIPTGKQKRILLVEFARRNLVVYGKAFDVVKLRTPIDLDDADDVKRHLDDIVLCEIKSTNRDLPLDFKGYFFALTTAELLVLQSLKDRYRFLFVNTVSQSHLELTLHDVFARAKGIYPTWSIMF